MRPILSLKCFNPPVAAAALSASLAMNVHVDSLRHRAAKLSAESNSVSFNF